MSAKIIAIEGLDAVGKNTQAFALRQKLLDLGYKASVFSWPNYKSESATFITKYLNGEYPDNVSRKAICLLFAMDRFNTIYLDDDFKDMIEDKDFVIFDRYVASNIICQCGLLEKEIVGGYIHIPGSVPDFEETKANMLRHAKFDLANWIYTTEHHDLGIPVPDVTVYLDLNPDTAFELLKARAEEDSRTIDVHETLENQILFYKSFQFVDRIYPDLYKVDCNMPDIKSSTEFNKRIRSIEDISADIFDIVKKKLIDKQLIYTCIH